MVTTARLISNMETRLQISSLTLQAAVRCNLMFVACLLAGMRHWQNVVFRLVFEKLGKQKHVYFSHTKRVSSVQEFDRRAYTNAEFIC